jgi:hypothetical protein
MPLAYFGVAPQMGMPVAAGGDIMIPKGLMVRPSIGGRTKRSKQRKQKKQKKQTKRIKQRGKQSGGFVPTIMEGFCMAASKYIVPLALFAGYKWMTRSKKDKKT